jgi:hypothetical protein
VAAIVEALCRVERRASALTWKRSPRVRVLLAGMACGEIPLTHQGLDIAGTDIATNHLRSLFEHAGVVAARDEPLAQFERWLVEELGSVTEPAVRAAVEQFARWIAEVIKFLTWLPSAHHRALASCRQDVDEWLALGPTTRLKIRNLLAWAKKTRVNKSVLITHRSFPAARSPSSSVWHGCESLLRAIANRWLTVSPESFCSCTVSP